VKDRNVLGHDKERVLVGEGGKMKRQRRVDMIDVFSTQV
jgi:hypothetical protein